MITVLSQTQRVVVNPAPQGSVAVVNAGPMGPTGPTGPSEVADILTADGQLVTRASGLLVPITRASLANDQAFTSKFAPIAEGVRVFSDSAERDSFIPTPYEGMAAYLQDTNKTTWYNGSAWNNAEWGAAWGMVGYAQLISDSATFTTLTDISGLSVTWTAVTNRIYEIIFHGLLNSTVNNDNGLIYFRDGSNTQLKNTGAIALPAAGYGWGVQMILPRYTPSGGSKTVKVSAERLSGTGNLKIMAASTFVSQITVKDVGPNG